MSTRYPNVTNYYITPEDVKYGIKGSVKRQQYEAGKWVPDEYLPVVMQSSKQGRKAKSRNKLHKRPTGKVPKYGMGGGAKKNGTRCIVM